MPSFLISGSVVIALALMPAFLVFGQERIVASEASAGVLHAVSTCDGLRIEVNKRIRSPNWWIRAATAEPGGTRLRSLATDELQSWNYNEQYNIYLPKSLVRDTSRSDCTVFSVDGKIVDIAGAIGRNPNRSLLATQRIAVSHSKKWLVVVKSSNYTSPVELFARKAEGEAEFRRHTLHGPLAKVTGGLQAQLIDCSVTGEFAAVYSLNQMRASMDIIELNSFSVLFHYEVGVEKIW